MKSDDWQRKFSGRRLWMAVAALVVFFFFDDVLILYLADELEILRSRNWLYWLITLWLLLGSVGLAFAVVRILQRPPTTGAEGILGVKAVVVEKKDHHWLVKFRGEIWTAESDDLIQTGDMVRVIAVESLRLRVTAMDHDSVR